MGNCTYVSLEQDQFAGSTLVAPSPFYGHTGQLALDLWLNDVAQGFHKVGWLHTPHVLPLVGGAPLDWMPKSALAHPIELYCNGRFTVLQIRSSVKAEDFRQLFIDLALWAKGQQFAQLLVLSTNLVLTRPVPEGERAFYVKSSNCGIELAVSEYQLDESIKELLRGEDVPEGLLESPALPFAILFSSDLKLFDFSGAEDLVSVLATTWGFEVPRAWPRACEVVRA